MENNLKPCPICDSTEKLMVYSEYLPLSKISMGVVECTNNFCPIIIRAQTIEEAVEKWNTRPREDFLLEQNKALAEQLIIDEEIENELRYKLKFAIDTLEEVMNIPTDVQDYINSYISDAIKKIKGENE